MPEVVFIGNSNDLELVSLTLRSDGSSVTGATVTMTSMVDVDGTEVTGGNSLPATISHVGSGSYTLRLSSDYAFTEGSMYYTTITADAGSGIKGEWTIALRAVKRRV